MSKVSHNIKPRAQLYIFLTLSMLLVVEDNIRVKWNRSLCDTESLEIVEFYCCGNH